MKSHEVRVRQTSKRAEFLLESIDRSGVNVLQPFERHALLAFLVPGDEYSAEGSRTQLSFDAKALWLTGGS